MAYFLGIDFGTSSVKAIVIDEESVIHAQHSQDLPSPHQLATEHGCGYEQSPAIWWQGLLKLLEQLKHAIPLKQIKALAVDGTSGTVLLTDQSGNPLGNALMYNDSRSEIETEQIKQLYQSLKQQQNVNQALGNISALARILWLNKQYPHKKVRFAMSQADWIVSKLAAQFTFSDYNNALKMAYDPVRKCWPSWLAQLDLANHSLPRVFQPGTFISHLSSQWSNLGFATPTALIAGTTDSTAAIMASGAAQPGQAVTSLGSTLVMKIISEYPINDQSSGVYSQPYADYWLVGGGSNSGGAVLKHYFKQAQIEQYSRQINTQQSSELDYYPLLSVGERFPICDASLKPRLTPRPDDEKLFFQGILEGMAAIEAQAYKKLQQLGAPPPSSIISMGGGAKNSAWGEIRAKALGVPVHPAKIDQAAYGTACLALRGYLKIKQIL